MRIKVQGAGKQIARLSEIDFGTLTPKLTEQITAVNDGRIESACLTFNGTRFLPDPYFQCWKGAPQTLTGEIISNGFLKTKLDADAISKLASLGWQSPDDTNPNIYRNFKLDSDPVVIAIFVLTSMRLAFGISTQNSYTLRA